MKGTPASPQCGFSNYVVTALNYYGVPDYFSVNVLDDEEIRNEVKKYSEWPTIPQLFVASEFIGGCDIIADMHNKNELRDFFIKHKCIPS
jgi:monothiol glutaredoxin